jgi:cell surface protein SprA
VWVNELRLKESNNEGGWAASGTMNMHLSDLGTVNLTGRYITDGFGGLEETIMQRSTETEQSYSVTASIELGKFFPDKAKVEAPLYYSYTKETISPKYNPLDTDMRLDDALESTKGHERDSIESIAVTKNISRNFSISNARWGLKNKRHPMPYDPANFSFSYSHAHRFSSGETTVWEKDDQWRGSLGYTYSPVYKTWEPFKKLKGKSKWLNFPKALGLNYLPQNITFNSELSRVYYELQERDLENTENPNLPISFSEQFLWNREFSLRWDLTKNLHMNFQSATHAEIEEPYTPLNKDLYPDSYSHWKDSVWHSVKHMGAPLDYQQSFTGSYQLPLDKLPVFDWLKSDASYTANYYWLRGTELDDGTSLGNTIRNDRNLNVNGSFNFETLYNHIPFLKKVNERFKKQPSKTQAKKKPEVKRTPKGKDAEGDKDAKAGDAAEQKALPKNKNTYQREITLLPDTTIEVQHGKKSKRLYVTAKTKDGKSVQLKWKTTDDNKIKVWLPKSEWKRLNLAAAKKSRKDTALVAADTLAADTSRMMAAAGSKAGKKSLDVKSDSKIDGKLDVKVSVMAKKPLEDLWWYNPTQMAARLLMTLRTLNISYRNQYSMQLPGFIPNVGDAFGQRTGSVLSPGLDFAFGLTGDDYIQKALDHGWLLCNDSVATPSNSSSTEDLQLRATLEPVRDLKIDLSATRTATRSKSVQFMYAGTPTTFSGTFNMTTLSLRSALEGIGNAGNGYHSASFDRLCASLPAFRERVQGRYPAEAAGIGATNPVDAYSADVLIPAFLNAYTTGAGGSLDIFPALTRLLPNWTLRYGGLSKLPWLRDHFKSVNLNHSYKSIYSVGSYASYSSWIEYMGDLGYVMTADGSYTPSSMYNISTVSINESFAPLFGVDVTFNSGLTLKAEYKTTRVLNLQMTSVQINESRSNDWVVGFGYKISNFNLFGAGSSRKIKKAQGGKGKNSQDDDTKSKNQNQRDSKRGGVNHDLNTRLDISFRDQAAITRDISTGVSSASSGNSALRISFSADYTLSRMLTLSAYYDQQVNTPLLSASSYPTTTRDFGLALKFSLTR